ncbi:hypothetical protein HDU96_007041 [Phlyctochytrium bullatum]|nr:hypothetical protein HDU96_007041 [Phlyctochytrium bullatum]
MSIKGASVLLNDNEETSDFTFDDFLIKVKHGLFGVLFVTNKNSDHNLALHLLETIIDHMQDLAFAICFMHAPWQSEIYWFQTLVKWFSPEKLIKNTPVLFTILLSSLGFVLLNALWVGYSFSQNRFRFIWTLKLLRVTLGLFSTILYIPFLAFFAMAVCECGPNHDLTECWNNDNLLKSVLTVFVITLFIILAFCVKATFFDPDAKTKDISCRPHSRMDLMYLAIRTVLTVLTIVMEVYAADYKHPEKKPLAIWSVAITCVVASFILAWSFIWYIPYYHFNYAMFRAALMANFFWASLCFLYTVLRPYSDIGIIYIIFAPCAMAFACFLIKARRHSIQRMAVSSVKDPFILELHIRFRLMDADLLFHDSHHYGGAHDMEVGGAAGPNARKGGDTMSGIAIGGAKATNGDCQSNETLMRELVESYSVASRLMPKSCMLQIFAGSFHLFHLNNRAQCLATYSKAESMNPRMDEAFMIYRRQQMLNDRFSGGDVIDFIAFEQNMQLARKHEKKATEAVIHFWSELLKKHPSYRNLQHHGTKISTAVSSAQSHYLALIKLSPDAPHVYRLYGNFLINVMNDAKQGKDLIEHAEDLEEEHQNRTKDEFKEAEDGLMPDNLNLDLLSDENATITISGERQNIGQILHMNSVTTKVFGYKKGELVGCNISTLLPSPFSESHDLFILKYLETGMAKVVDRARQVLGKHKDGTLFPLTLCVKHIVDKKGTQTFVGVMKPQSLPEGIGFLILSETLEIIHFSEAAGKLFDIRPSDPTEDDSRPTLTQLLPSVTLETSSQFLAKGGMKIPYVKNGEQLDVVLHGDNVQVTGASCFVCRIKIKMPHKAEKHNVPEVQTTDMDALPVGGCPFLAQNPPGGVSRALSPAASMTGVTRSSRRQSFNQTPFPGSGAEDMPNRSLLFASPWPEEEGRRSSSAFLAPGVASQDNAQHSESSLQLPMAFDREDGIQGLPERALSMSAGERDSQGARIRNPTFSALDSNKIVHVSLVQPGGIGGPMVRATAELKDDPPTPPTPVAPILRKSPSSLSQTNSPMQVPRDITKKFSFSDAIPGSLDRPRRVSEAAYFPSGSPRHDEEMGSAPSEKGSSPDSATSKDTSAKTYMKRIVQIKNERSGRQVQRLHMVFVLCLIVVAVTAVIELVEFRRLYHSVLYALDHIWMENDVAMHILTMADDARSLDLRRSTGWNWTTAASVPSEQYARQEMSENTLRVRETLSVFSVCKKRDGLLRSADGRTRQVYPEPLEIISKVVAAAKFLGSAPFSEREYASETMFVLQNAPFEAYKVANACSFNDRADAFALGRQLPPKILGLTSIAPVICLLIFTCAIQPLYLNIEDSKERFIRMFYDIPKEVVSAIHESHLKRIMESEDDDIEDLDIANRFAMEKIYSSIANGEGTVATSEHRKSSIFADDSSPNRNPFLRWIDKASHDHHRVALKTVLIFLLTVAHFFIIGGLSYVYMSNVEQVGQRVYWSSQRQILVRRTTFLIREAFVDLVRNMSIRTGSALADVPVPLNITEIYVDLDDSITDLEEVSNGILYGDVERSLQGIIWTGYSTPQVYHELQDACVASSPADCSTFDDGVMKRGLFAARAWYQKRVNTIMANITRVSTLNLRQNSTSLRNLDYGIAAARKLDLEYLFPAFEEATKSYLTGFRQTLEWFSSFNLSFSVCFVVITILIYLVIVRPLTKAIGDDLRRTSALVYMLPAEVFATVPSFRKWVEGNLNGSAAGFGGETKKKAKTEGEPKPVKGKVKMMDD